MLNHQDYMTSRERMEALYNYRRPDRVPIGMQYLSIGFNTVKTGSTITEAYADPEKSFHAFLKVVEEYGWDQILQCFRHTVNGADDFGGEVRLPKGEYEGALVLKSHPVKNEKDVDILELPDPIAAGGIPIALQFAEFQAAHGLPVTFFSRSPFCMAANICGIESFLKWMYKNPALCIRLMEMALEHIFNVLALWTTRFGAENMFVWMSSPTESNQLISPKHMQEFALPFHAAYHERLRALGIRRFGIHICGDQNLNLPFLADKPLWSHPSVISIGAEVRLEDAARFFPKDIIMGNIDPSEILMRTPPQLYELTRQTIENGKSARGGFILAAGCDIPPMVPPENLHAITRAANDFGGYS